MNESPLGGKGSKKGAAFLVGKLSAGTPFTQLFKENHPGGRGGKQNLCVLALKSVGGAIRGGKL